MTDTTGTLGEVMFSRAQIQERVEALAERISVDYAGRVPILVCVLKGATMFACDLSRALSIDHELDFLALNAYGAEVPGMHAQVLKDVQIPIAGRDVLLVEDIVDTGLTLQFVLRWLEARDPASVETVTLLDRPQRRIVECPLAYRGFPVPDRFFVGYGFDFQQQYRNLPDLREFAIGDPGASIFPENPEPAAHR